MDVVDLDWQVDMAKARAILGRQKVMVGNLDPANAVKRGTPGSIRKAPDGSTDYEVAGSITGRFSG